MVHTALFMGRENALQPRGEEVVCGVLFVYVGCVGFFSLSFKELKQAYH